MRVTPFMLTTAAALIFAAGAHAELVTYVGTDFDTGANWRNTADYKGVYGSYSELGQDAWFVAGASGSTHISASYISAISTAGVSVYPGNGGYVMIDDPNSTTGGLIRSGTLNPNPGTNSSTVEMTITFGANAPALVQVAVMIDNLDIANFNPNSVTFSQVGGSGTAATAVTTGASYFNRSPDLMYFDIAGITSGDVFKLSATGGPNGTATVGAVAFDTAATTATPEPGTVVLAAAAIILVLLMNRANKTRVTDDGSQI